MNKHIAYTLCSILLLITTSGSAAKDGTTSSIQSGSSTTAILELYTSEGCNSCPAADKYLKNMVEKHQGNKQFIPLAFHVDYWDYIGWKDPYSRPQHGTRQRSIAMRNKLNSLYTPQFVLHGQDFPSYQNIPEAISIINNIPAQASISVKATLNNLQLQTDILVEANNERSQQYSDVFIAVTENNLSSQITDGENDGLHLQHDYVVRQFLGPFSLDGKNKLNIKKSVTLDKTWKLPDLNLIVFVQDSKNGTTHQAVQVPLTP